MCAHICMWIIREYMFVNVRKYINMNYAWIYLCQLCVNRCVWIYNVNYAWIYVCQLCVNIYIWMCVNICVWMCVNICKWMCVNICMWIIREYIHMNYAWIHLCECVDLLCELCVNICIRIMHEYFMWMCVMLMRAYIRITYGYLAIWFVRSQSLIPVLAWFVRLRVSVLSLDG